MSGLSLPLLSRLAHDEQAKEKGCALTVLYDMAHRAVAKLQQEPSRLARPSEVELRRASATSLQRILSLHLEDKSGVCECGETMPCPTLLAVEPIVMSALISL